MPSTQETPSRNDASVQNKKPVGALVLSLIALGSFFVIYSYMDASTISPAPQTAAVATTNYFEDISLEGHAAFVVDLATDRVLYEKNADAQLALASITKVPLAIVVAETMPRNISLEIPYNTGPEGSRNRLVKGEKWQIQDLIDFTLVASSNVGADILASSAENAVRAKYPLAPLSNAVLWRMNNFATELGLTNTYFLNVSGLDESTTQSGSYGSARDVAKIFSYAEGNYSDVFAGTAENGVLLSNDNGDVISAANTNEALGELPGLIMGKTGFTDIAGGNLAIVFDIGLAHPVVAVVLGSSREGRFADMKELVGAARKAIMQN